jgi:S1-C subfamily serine protease
MPSATAPRPPLGRQSGATPTPAPEPAAPAPGNAAAQGRHRPRTSTRWLVVAVVILALALTAVVAFRWGAAHRTDAAAAAETGSTTTEESPPTSLAPAAVYQQILPSFVAVRIAGGGVGGGVLVSSDGLILTASSLVSDDAGAPAAGLAVTFADGTDAAATVIATDDSLGIAVLAPSAFPEVIVPAVLGAPGAVGAPVTVVGNPLDLTASLTAGVVSGLDRSATTPAGAALTGLVQFDAAVGAGSLGGPLLNERAEVTGVVVAVAGDPAETEVSSLGFAVPIGAAVGVAAGEQLPR